ncbi:hypothetical protein [Roseiflexus sp.]|nr:hypothetical protein [Roseiflexus sp.]PMP80995.1 MAG: hypothetical protein C0183_13135 [Roseiflexus castenholzii]GIV99515.1 MAG: hypothetical protein KatS3mg058_0919 [Roseiflexus sp.]
MTQEQTSQQQKVDTGPLPPLPPLPEPPPSPRQASRRTMLVAGIAVLAVAGIALWWFTRPSDPMSDPRPVQTVQNFVAATEARDVSRMLSYVEPTDLKRQISPELRSYMEYITDLQFKNETYTLVDNNGSIARVRLTGTVRYTVDYGSVYSGERSFDTIFELVLLEGTWYLRSLQLPELEQQ